MLIAVDNYLNLLNYFMSSATTCSNKSDLINLKRDVTNTVHDLEEDEKEFLKTNCPILEPIKSKLVQLENDLSNRIENVCA